MWEMKWWSQVLEKAPRPPLHCTTKVRSVGPGVFLLLFCVLVCVLSSGLSKVWHRSRMSFVSHDAQHLTPSSGRSVLGLPHLCLSVLFHTALCLDVLWRTDERNFSSFDVHLKTERAEVASWLCTPRTVPVKIWLFVFSSFLSREMETLFKTVIFLCFEY